MIDYAAKLNDEQHEIVTKGDGHCLVLAGAGSGKTRTLTYRVAYLLEHGIKPENIVLMTFTNKAANEMTDRVKDLLGYSPHALWAGTFHRIGNRVLRKYGHLLGYTPSFAILDQGDSKDLLKLCFKELAIDTKNGNFPKVDVVRSMISYANNTGQDIGDWVCLKYNFPSFIAEKVKEIGDLYQSRKLDLNAMDFDDLLAQWLQLLKKFPQVKAELAKKFQYILVDEYQDTNNIQAQIIKQLSSLHHNILAVGDDSQSIYSFRAADISHILNFSKNFEDTSIFKLVVNYRSTPEILELANQSIAYNTSQYFKELKSVKVSGTLPKVIASRNVYNQADHIIDRLKEIQKEGRCLSSVAILFRAANHSAELQLALSQHSMPFIVRSGLRYFDQAHIKDLLAILRVWSNFNDELSWKRFLRLLPGIGERTAAKIYQQVNSKSTLAEVLESEIKLSAKQAKSWSIVLDILGHLVDLSDQENYSIADGIKYIFDIFYKDHLKNTFDDAGNRGDDIMAFINFSTQYDNLQKLLTDITLDENYATGDRKDDDSKKLILSTIHQAKGLEWDEVMVIGLREGGFPHYRSRESLSELEEERRLFYVAVTRAKDYLTLLYPVRVMTYEYGEMMSDPSLFIQELDQEAYEKYPKTEKENLEHRSYLTRNTRWSSTSGQDYFSDDSDDDEPVVVSSKKKKKENQDDGSQDDGWYDDDVVEYND